MLDAIWLEHAERFYGLFVHNMAESGTIIDPWDDLAEDERFAYAISLAEFTAGMESQ